MLYYVQTCKDKEHWFYFVLYRHLVDIHSEITLYGRIKNMYLEAKRNTVFFNLLQFLFWFLISRLMMYLLPMKDFWFVVLEVLIFGAVNGAQARPFFKICIAL